MDLIILDTNLEPCAVLDTYSSFIWTDRYTECGDFEIFTKMSSELLEFIKQDYYIEQPGSDRTMIIEKLLIESDIEDGDTLTVTGRSLESILDRRIIWGQKNVKGNFQNEIKALLNEAIISPSNANRKIPNFIFEESTDPRITELTIDAQYTGDNLYDVIASLCYERDVGFSVIKNENKQFVFRLYMGEDRSYEQTKHPYVVFSPKFDNLISSNYIESKASMKNVTLIGGEELQDEPRVYTNVGNVAGLNRREIFTDASGVSRTVDEEELLQSEYIALLKQKGRETLIEEENRYIRSFEGEVETALMFKYGEDFFAGDIVQIENAYGQESKARVVEVVTSDDESGCITYPTFEIIPYEELPPGYLNVSYIQSNGSQYINTEVTPTNNTRIVLDIEILDAKAAPIFGVEDAEGLSLFGAYVSNETTYSSYFGNDKQDVAVPSVLGRIKVDKNRNSCDFTSNGVVNADSVFTSALELYLLASNKNKSVSSEKLSARIYSVMIYEQDTLIRKMVPAKNENDTPGLYDFVEEKFYTNRGSGSFTTDS